MSAKSVFGLHSAAGRDRASRAVRNIDVSMHRCESAGELYITARPEPGTAGGRNAKRAMGDLFDSIADTLRQHNAFVLQERVFAHESVMASLHDARASAFGDLADGVEPTWLAVPLGAYGSVAGVQVHAVAGCTRPDVLSVDGEPSGRLATFPAQTGPQRYLTGCNLQANRAQQTLPADQAKAMFAKAEAVLAQAGGSLADVARTWLWLGDILGWYGEFNVVRNELFQARGLLTNDGGGILPASTGIGIGPATLGHQRRHCVMDFFAALDTPKTRCLLAGGNQGAASKYGSAFSRAVITKTPGGKTVYVSGTAAIDVAGQTTHLGDAAGQIADTLQNVRAVLKDAGCDQDDVVQAMAYCKTPQVEQAFLNTIKAEGGSRPWITTQNIVAIADVCRDNLLFEIEATAIIR